MVQTLATLLDGLGHRTVIARGREQLHVALGHLQQRFLDAVTLDDFAMIDFGSEGALVVVDGGFQIVDGDGHVVDFGENHVVSLNAIVTRGGTGRCSLRPPWPEARDR